TFSPQAGRRTLEIESPSPREAGRGWREAPGEGFLQECHRRASSFSSALSYHLALGGGHGPAPNPRHRPVLLCRRRERGRRSAALGHPYGPNAERGVFRSRDGGKTWKRILGKGDDTGAIDLAFEQGNSKVIYASMWQTRRTPWSVYPPSNGPGSGLFKSTDGGD